MTQVKICGLTNYEDARFAARAGADLLGFVFAESPRRVTRDATCEMMGRLRSEGLTVPLGVGVFVDPIAADVIRICTQCELTIAQLHGAETPETCRMIAEAGISVIKSFRVRDHISLQTIERYDMVSFVHFDTYDPERAGGTGRAFDHSLVAGLSKRFRILLSGGLTPENVAGAIALVRPWGVDVSSGVEIAPGRKDPAKVEAFIRNARGGAPEKV
jgi:phosphoribosylanthranilate isomerase